MTNTHNGDLAELTTVGVDIDKDVFHLVGFDTSGAVVPRKKIKRLTLVPTFEALPRCVVGIGACPCGLCTLKSGT